MVDGYKTIWERIKADEFKNTLPYSLDEEIEKHEKYQELTKEILQLQFEIASLESTKSMLVSDIKRSWNNRDFELRAKFKEALEKAYKMQGHPKKDKIWKKAWASNHSGCWIDILIAYNELVELIS